MKKNKGYDLVNVGAKSINELFGVSNEDYTTQSQDLALLCVDRLAETGKLNYKAIADYIISELRFRHFGKTDTDNNLSIYEKELFVSGMLMRYLLLPDTEKHIGCAAYAKNLENGLNDY